MKKYLHIVCHDVPYPVDYGGVFDLYCKLKALKEEGIGIYLHCFEYGRGRQPALNEYCEAVYYYPRKKGLQGLSLSLPYIVSSRASTALLENLLKNNYPILLEGIHCTWPALQPALQHRKVFIRLHNVEYAYYHQLYRHARLSLKKLYYYAESILLKKYERRLAKKNRFLAVSEKDVHTYTTVLGAAAISYLPVFIPWKNATGLAGSGSYCIYHANLSVEENEKAALWLIENIFAGLNIPLLVTGKNPSPALQRLAAAQKNISVLANPDAGKMASLVAEAQVNVLPSFNETGIKLKLINALFNGRHCVVNEAAVEDTGLQSLCHIADEPVAMQQLITTLFHQPFTVEDKIQREALLTAAYNNRLQAAQLIALIW